MSKLYGLFDDFEDDIYSASSIAGEDVAKEDVKPEEPLGLSALPRSGLAPISTTMMDEALQRVIGRMEIKPENAAAFANLAARDINSPFSHTYYASKQAAVHAARSGVSKQRIKIKPILDEKNVESLQMYAPEYQFEFVNTSSVDHSMAHVMRKVDHRLLWSRIPPSSRVVDVGGNPIYYIHEGFENVHVCGAISDPKDASRSVLREGMAKTLINKPDVDSGVKQLAKRYLNKDPEFVCGKIAQECRYKAPILMSLHVYDIPLRDWPGIMINRGAYTVEGCILFSEKIMYDTSGSLGIADARFEVDAKANLMKMGFADSPSMWYSHDWTEYCRYGCDQILQHPKSSEYFSYKIIERRGDTVFFRILRGKGRDLKRSVKTRICPDMDLVKVHGFELTQTESLSPLSKKIYYFPKNLWYSMVSQAAEDYERGVLDFTAMYRYYRSVSVRQTVNAVLIIGGEPVTPELLVPLIVHSCLAAAAQSVLGQRETRGLTDMAMSARKTLGRQALDRFGRWLSTAVLLPFIVAALPFKAIYRAYKEFGRDHLEKFLITWEPVAEIVSVPIDRIKLVARGDIDADQIEHQYLDAVVEAQESLMLDHCRALVSNPEMFSKYLDVADGKEENPSSNDVSTDSDVVMDEKVKMPEPDVIVIVEPTEDSQSTRRSNVTRTTYNTENGPNLGQPTLSAEDMRTRAIQRKLAIREHIEEIKVTMRATESSCAASFRHLWAAGKPRPQLLFSSDDHHSHPDFWYIREGVVNSSIKGLKGSDFTHSAVYSPDLLKSGSCICSVTCDNRKDHERKGEPLVFKLQDSKYTGYVFTNDSLAVHNGNEIVKTLELALDLDHNYNIRVTQAPPGCGKTHTIKGIMQTDGSDMFACPVRESAISTRKEFVADHPHFKDADLRMRTVDSYLANYSQDRTKALKAKRLLADELYMTHAGKWYAMAGLLGVDEVWGYGDLKQIPHIPRVEVACNYLRVVPDIEDGMWVNYRNPANAVAAWGHLYDNKLRANSKIEGRFDQVKNLPMTDIEPGTVMMCMYQATKIDLKKIYKNSLDKIKIMTAHESEGKTFDNVWLHKLDARVRTDKSSLYDSEPHCLVAASRHRKDFVYVNYGADDLISSWAQNAKNANKILAVSNVDTAGETFV